MKNSFSAIRVWLIKLLCLAALIAFGMISRFTNGNWDSGNHLHPDERFITMVTDELAWPSSWQNYFNTSESPLNPHNRTFDFYVYGQWPLFLVKALAQSFGLDDYGGITLVGRGLSATLELGTLLVVIMIGSQLTPKKYRFLGGFLSGFSYVSFTLPIQMAHYFVVDPYLVFCLAILFLLLIQKPSFKIFLGVGVFFGLAIGAKVSAVYFALVIGLRLIQLLLQKTLTVKKLMLLALTLGITSIITVRIVYPMLFEAQGFWPTGINIKVLNNWKSLQAFDGKDTQFPPALQWIPTSPVVYLLTQTAVWGVGLPLTTITIIVFIFIWRTKKKWTIHSPIWLALAWVLVLLLYQSLQFAKTLRYIYPVLPFLAVVLGATLAQFEWRTYKKTSLCILVLFFLGLWWSWSFQSVYRRAHTRVTASSWIYQYVPPNSVISYEYWDDALPLPVQDQTAESLDYRIVELPLYDPDSQEKWLKLSATLAEVDYVVLSSNRLWRSLSALPERYPTTARYYKLLFTGELGFTKVAQVSSYPCLIGSNQKLKNLEISPPLQPNIVRFIQTDYCALAVADDGAEEAVTVYDHPVVLIFKNTGKLSPAAIRKTLLQSKYR